MFDLIVGVSTGAIIGALLTAKRLSIEKCKEVYIEISRELFSQGKFSGMSGLLLSHAYYNTEKWKQILKNVSKRIFQNTFFLNLIDFSC